MVFKALLTCALAATIQAVTVKVASSGGNATSPYQYGIMFEDINNSGDGGVYAELIQNRAFQGNAVSAGWDTIDRPTVLTINCRLTRATSRTGTR